MTILGFRKQELSTCRSIASIATPPEYRLIYTHMAALGVDRSGLNEEVMGQQDDCHDYQST